MSELADVLGAVKKPKKGPPCGMGLTLSELDDRDREALEAALRDRRVSGTFIRQALEQNGHDLSLVQVARHRRGECQCP